MDVENETEESQDEKENVSGAPISKEEPPLSVAEEKTEFFYGRGYHSVDDKNRIKLPAEIRAQLGEKKFRLAKGPEHKIYVYTVERADEILRNMHVVVMKNSKDRKLIAALKSFTSSMTLAVDVDAQDRFNFPQWLMNWGGIKKKDTLVTYGFDDHFEIELASVYEAENKAIADDDYTDAILEFLS